MMHVLPCEQVREELTAYHDGELAIETQVLIQGHLHECVACRLEAASLAELSDGLRAMASSVPGREPRDTGLITGAVLERIRVERQYSFTAQWREWFQDMHLIWAGLGATAAVLFCVYASAGVLHAASKERPDSLAGIISTIASGSTDYVRLADTAYENHALLDSTEALDADLMLSAFVTRDGRIQNVELLEEQARALQVQPDEVLAMMAAASRARFSTSSIGGAFPGGVNVVWFVTSTTVKGAPDYDLYLVSPPRLAAPAVFGPKPRKAPTPSAKTTTPTSNDGLAA
jgi:predicted anti-sigma-YlaC factor YlaD